MAWAGTDANGWGDGRTDDHLSRVSLISLHGNSIFIMSGVERGLGGGGRVRRRGGDARDGVLNPRKTRRQAGKAMGCPMGDGNGSTCRYSTS